MVPLVVLHFQQLIPLLLSTTASWAVVVVAVVVLGGILSNTQVDIGMVLAVVIVGLLEVAPQVALVQVSQQEQVLL
jgi:hypothetical protein